MSLFAFVFVISRAPKTTSVDIKNDLTPDLNKESRERESLYHVSASHDVPSVKKRSIQSTAGKWYYWNILSRSKRALSCEVHLVFKLTRSLFELFQKWLHIVFSFIHRPLAKGKYFPRLLWRKTLSVRHIQRSLSWFTSRRKAGSLVWLCYLWHKKQQVLVILGLRGTFQSKTVCWCCHNNVTQSHPLATESFQSQSRKMVQDSRI